MTPVIFRDVGWIALIIYIEERLVKVVALIARASQHASASSWPVAPNLVMVKGKRALLLDW